MNAEVFLRLRTKENLMLVVNGELAASGKQASQMVCKEALFCISYRNTQYNSILHRRMVTEFAALF